MSGGCTNCGKKGGCDSRKHEMLGQVHEALSRLYPSKRWDERNHEAALGQGIGAERGEILAAALADKLKAFAMFRPGAPEDFSDYVYVLCFGRQPCILELQEGLAPAAALGLDAAWPQAGLQEVYLRVALSSLAPFAAVQEVRMELRPLADERDGVLVEQQVRAGVFDPILLTRYQKLVAVLTEQGIKNVDFGEINEAPDGYDGGSHVPWFGMAATIANYLFFAGPTAGITAETVLGTAEGPNRNLIETWPEDHLAAHGLGGAGAG